jgi:hypothetical protein
MGGRGLESVSSGRQIWRGSSLSSLRISATANLTRAVSLAVNVLTRKTWLQNWHPRLSWQPPLHTPFARPSPTAFPKSRLRRAGCGIHARARAHASTQDGSRCTELLRSTSAHVARRSPGQTSANKHPPRWRQCRRKRAKRREEEAGGRADGRLGLARQCAGTKELVWNGTHTLEGKEIWR